MKRICLLICVLLSASLGYGGIDYKANIDPLNPVFTSITTTGGGVLGTFLRIGTTLDVAGPQTNVSSVTVKGLQVVDQTYTKTLTVGGTSYFGGIATFASGGTLTSLEAGVLNTARIDLTGSVYTPYIYAPASTNMVIRGGNTGATGGGTLSLSGNNGTAKYVVIGQVSQIIAPSSMTINASTMYTSTFDAMGNLYVPQNSYIGQNLSANTATVSSMTVTTGIAVGSAIGGIYKIKGISSDEVLLVTTPALFDCYISSTDYRIWIATSATLAGFKRSAAFGATP